jgi:hypothetical protein
LHIGLYLVNLMDRNEGPDSALTIALQGGLYLAIIMDRYDGRHTSVTLSLLRGLYVAIAMYLMKAPTLTLL